MYNVDLPPRVITKYLTVGIPSAVSQYIPRDRGQEKLLLFDAVVLVWHVPASGEHYESIGFSIAIRNAQESGNHLTDELRMPRGHEQSIRNCFKRVFALAEADKAEIFTVFSSQLLLQLHCLVGPTLRTRVNPRCQVSG
jgi:hypothetical protein